MRFRFFLIFSENGATEAFFIEVEILKAKNQTSSEVNHKSSYYDSECDMKGSIQNAVKNKLVKFLPLISQF